MATSTPLRPGAPTEHQQLVFVVDDNAGYRRAISSVVTLTTGVQLIGEATCGQEALDALMPTSLSCLDPLPDLVVMDVHLGDMSGIEVARRLTAEAPGLRVLLVSTMSETDLPGDAATCGAIGFVRKDRFGPAVLSDAIGVHD